MFIRKIKDLFHVGFCKNSSSRVRWVYYVHKWSFLVDKRCRVLKIDFKVRFFFEFVRHCDSFHSRTEIMVEWITHLRHQNFIAFVSKGHQYSQQTHIDSVIDMHVRGCDWHFRTIKLSYSLSESWNTNRSIITMIIFVHDALPHDFIA